MSIGPEAILYVKKNEDKVLRRNKGKITDWSKPIWVSNIEFIDIPDFANSNNLHDTIVQMGKKDQLVCVRFRWFFSNGKIVEVDKLYPDENELMALFLKKRNALRLITIPSKSIKEIVSTGLDSDGQYRFPLVLVRRLSRYESINL